MKSISPFDFDKCTETTKNVRQYAGHAELNSRAAVVLYRLRFQTEVAVWNPTWSYLKEPQSPFRESLFFYIE